ncbi:MAG: hypothetical protein R2771_15890 [Saprospiraceae bacterium]
MQAKHTLKNASNPDATKKMMEIIMETYDNPNNIDNAKKADSISPILAAKDLGPAFINSGFIPVTLSPFFIRKQNGLYFTPKNTRIEKSNKTTQITIGF